MKTGTLAALALALPLSISSAWATTTNYSTGTSFVIDDKSSDIVTGIVTGGTFDLSKLSFTSISNITLTLTYADVGPKSGELWTVYVNGTSYGTLSKTEGESNPQPLTLTFNSSTNASTYASILASKTVTYSFAEGTSGTDKFTINNATLSVTGTAAPIPEPESYALFAAGLALVGAVARRRKARNA